MPKENIIVPDNGLIIEIQNGGEKIVALPERVSNDIIVVDGTNVGKVQDMVLRDRDNLREGRHIHNHRYYRSEYSTN